MNELTLRTLWLENPVDLPSISNTPDLSWADPLLSSPILPEVRSRYSNCRWTQIIVGQLSKHGMAVDISTDHGNSSQLKFIWHSSSQVTISYSWHATLDGCQAASHAYTFHANPTPEVQADDLMQKMCDEDVHKKQQRQDVILMDNMKWRFLLQKMNQCCTSTEKVLKWRPDVVEKCCQAVTEAGPVRKSSARHEPDSGHKKKMLTSET